MEDRTSQKLSQHKFISLETSRNKGLFRKDFVFRVSILLIIALLFHVVAPKGTVLFGEGTLHSLSFLCWFLGGLLCCGFLRCFLG